VYDPSVERKLLIIKLAVFGLHFYHLKTVAEDSRNQGCDAVPTGK
jgi:hypothetical protein